MNKISSSYLAPSSIGLMRVNSSSRSKTLKEDGINERFIIKSEQIILKHEIGSGSFGSVILGDYFGAKVAVKMMKRSFKNEAMLMEEAFLLSNIKPHPNLCRFIGILNDQDHLAMIVGFVRDGSVLDCLSKQKFTLEQKYDIIQQSASG